MNQEKFLAGFCTFLKIWHHCQLTCSFTEQIGEKKQNRNIHYKLTGISSAELVLSLHYAEIKNLKNCVFTSAAVSSYVIIDSREVLCDHLVTDTEEALIGVGLTGSNVGEGVLEVNDSGAAKLGGGLTDVDDEEEVARGAPGAEEGAEGGGGGVVLQGTEGKSGDPAVGGKPGNPGGFWCKAAAR